MKTLLSGVVLVAASLGFINVASAQSCVQNAGTISAPVTNLAGNSCQGSSSLAQACGNTETLNGAGVAIYQVTVGATNSFTIAVNSAVFIPWIGFVSTTCSSNTACLVDATIAAAGTVTSGLQSGLPAGTYFIFVGDISADAPGCGAFTVTVQPTLPVRLQEFSVK